ncbi:MAG: ABC transporter permease subunit [Polyangiaceae bacterium]|nr:ABC transporter permease subunit [Polyangiaceae bacterium]
MGRVARALVLHELLERTRDRWVVVVSVVFALLASGVSLYARSAEASAERLTGPSLVTLVGLVVPLIALVLGHDAIVGERERNTLGLLLSLPISKLELVMAKFVGRCLALCLALAIGLGAALAFAEPVQRSVLAALIVPTILLGVAFLAIGVLVSATTRRQITAASIVVVIWFLFVFFYDLGILGVLVITDGQVSTNIVAGLVSANPAGLFRVEMMLRFLGPGMLDNLPSNVELPTRLGSAAIWAGWIALPPLVSALLLRLERGKR